MSSALSLYELDSEQADLLPARETLATITNPFVLQVNASPAIAVAAGTGNNRAAAATFTTQVSRIVAIR